MPYALGLMLLHFALRFWRRNAACMRWLWACIQAPRGCLDTSLTLRCTQACTLKHALSRQVLCPVHSTRHMHMHRILWRRKVACMRLLWACIQALRACLGTRLHAGMHADLVALSLAPCALCILPDTTISWSFGRFRRDFGSVNAACTPAYTPARQKLHTHLRASYILPFCVHGSILRAYTWLNTRGTDVC